VFKNISVIGSGLMESAIAAHFANVGCEVILLDIVRRGYI
jgi:3-hydroxyacyl-CoA dehydrogenase